VVCHSATHTFCGRPRVRIVRAPRKRPRRHANDGRALRRPTVITFAFRSTICCRSRRRRAGATHAPSPARISARFAKGSASKPYQHRRTHGERQGAGPLLRPRKAAASAARPSSRSSRTCRLPRTISPRCAATGPRMTSPRAPSSACTSRPTKRGSEGRPRAGQAAYSAGALRKGAVGSWPGRVDSGAIQRDPHLSRATEGGKVRPTRGPHRRGDRVICSTMSAVGQIRKRLVMPAWSDLPPEADENRT
jgi:hypothetical protein